MIYTTYESWVCNSVEKIYTQVFDNLKIRKKNCEHEID
jgi:hypothetical protein